MNSHARAAGAVLALAMTIPAFAAEVSGTQVNETDVGVSASDKNALAASEVARSRAWGLSETEWHRYEQLMQGIRGSISPPTISPIEVLGIHARDEDERRRYAELWARAMREDAERILAFQRAYDEAGRRLYPDQRLIDVGRLPGRDDKTSALQPGDRVLFFTRPGCPACESLLNQLRKRLNRVSGIDIYIAGVKPGDDQAIRRWAADHGIDPTWVRNQRVTLNHEAGALARLTQGKGEIPYLLRRRGKDLSVLRASGL
ncbi:MAG: TIGR03759 family integrating conjugative element protein [Pseudomonadota bacterium]